MNTLSVSEAVALVRKNLDELDPNGSIMYVDENGSSADFGDNRTLDGIIARNLPEAVNSIHLAAPVSLLEGIDGTSKVENVSLDTNGILSFGLDNTSGFLRLVAFQAADSDIVMSDLLPEASPEGRKQLNPYIRGRKDRPRLVHLQGRHSGPSFKYYTIGNVSDYVDNPESAIKQFLCIEEQIFSDQTTEYDISRRLRQNIIDYLTAMVMDTFADQRGQSFFQRANNFNTI